MCLHLTQPIPKKRKRSGYGYKVFRTNGGCFLFEFGNLYGSTVCPAGTWLHSGPCGALYYDSDRALRTGFHIFKSRRSADHYARYSATNNLCVVKVRYFDAFSEGVQDIGSMRPLKALVARRVYVPKYELRRIIKLDRSR